MGGRPPGRDEPRRPGHALSASWKAERVRSGRGEEGMSTTEIRTRPVRGSLEDRIGTITLDRPDRKNPLTFESYAELRDLFRSLASLDKDVKVVVVTGAGDNFCSGGDVHEIIGPLTKMSAPELLAFTRMTGDLVKAMRACPQPIIPAIHRG